MNNRQRSRVYRVARNKVLVQAWKASFIAIKGLDGLEAKKARSDATILLMDYLMASYFGVLNTNTVKRFPAGENVFFLPKKQAMAKIGLALEVITRRFQECPEGVLQAAGVKVPDGR